MKQYFPALDGLRFLASINIVLLHFSTSSLLTYVQNPYIKPIIAEPYFNATMFFVLSGFIYSIMFLNTDRIPTAINFMKARFMRLYPLHVACTIIIFAIILYRTSILDNTEYAVKTLALHLSLLWAFIPQEGYSLNQPSWTLSVFFICYLLTPAFAKFLNSNNKKLILWLLFVTSMLTPFLFLLYFDNMPNVVRGFFFFSGMLLGRLFQLRALPLPRKWPINDLLIIAVAVGYYMFICNKSALPGESKNYYLVTPMFYCILMALLANKKGFIVKTLSLKLIRKVGKASFYPYLIHAVMIETLHLHLHLIGWRVNPWNNPFATALLLCALYVCTIYNEKKLISRI